VIGDESESVVDNHSSQVIASKLIGDTDAMNAATRH
jgi:hypothetical protein